MKIFVDDIRQPPDKTWTLCRTIGEAVRLIVNFSSAITDISLDHDISYDVRIEGVYRPFPSPETYQPLAYVIGLVYYGEERVQPNITIHSANPTGSIEMQMIMESYMIKSLLVPMGQAHKKK